MNRVASSTYYYSSKATPSFLRTDHIKLSIKGSKTDQFQRSATVVIGATDTSTCPVRAMTRYLLATNGHASRPLFTLYNGSFLTRQAVSHMTKCMLSTAKVDMRRFSSHSYRIGAATATTAAGLLETLIQMLGQHSIQEICPILPGHPPCSCPRHCSPQLRYTCLFS